jgi:Tfp pilus assembly pilus retraction ATPase PilT
VSSTYSCRRKRYGSRHVSESLQAVISQTLLKKNGGGRVAAHEIMIGIPAIRNLVRENKVAQMYSAIQTGANYGMTTLDQSLKTLVSKGVISPQTARTLQNNLNHSYKNKRIREISWTLMIYSI